MRPIAHDLLMSGGAARDPAVAQRVPRFIKSQRLHQLSPISALSAGETAQHSIKINN